MLSGNLVNQTGSQDALSIEFTALVASFSLFGVCASIGPLVKMSAPVCKAAPLYLHSSPPFA